MSALNGYRTSSCMIIQKLNACRLSVWFGCPQFGHSHTKGVKANGQSLRASQNSSCEGKQGCPQHFLLCEGANRAQISLEWYMRVLMGEVLVTHANHMQYWREIEFEQYNESFNSACWSKTWQCSHRSEIRELFLSCMVFRLQKLLRFSHVPTVVFSAWILASGNFFYHCRRSSSADLHAQCGTLLSCSLLHNQCFTTDFGLVKISAFARGRAKEGLDFGCDIPV